VKAILCLFRVLLWLAAAAGSSKKTASKKRKSAILVMLASLSLLVLTPLGCASPNGGSHLDIGTSVDTLWARATLLLHHAHGSFALTNAPTATTTEVNFTNQLFLEAHKQGF